MGIVNWRQATQDWSGRRRATRETLVLLGYWSHRKRRRRNEEEKEDEKKKTRRKEEEEGTKKKKTKKKRGRRKEEEKKQMKKRSRRRKEEKKQKKKRRRRRRGISSKARLNICNFIYYVTIIFDITELQYKQEPFNETAINLHFNDFHFFLYPSFQNSPV